MHTLSAKGRTSQNVTGQLTVGIQAHFARAKQQSRLTNVMNGLFFFWAYGGFEPQKTLRPCQTRHHFFDIDIRKYVRQLQSGALRIDDLTRMRIKRMSIDIRGQDPIVAV